MNDIPELQPLTGVPKEDRPTYMGFTKDHVPQEAIDKFLEVYAVPGTLYRGKSGILLCGPIPKHLLGC